MCFALENLKRPSKLCCGEMPAQSGTDFAQCYLDAETREELGPDGMS